MTDREALLAIEDAINEVLWDKAPPYDSSDLLEILDEIWNILSNQNVLDTSHLKKETSDAGRY